MGIISFTFYLYKHLTCGGGWGEEVVVIPLN